MFEYLTQVLPLADGTLNARLDALGAAGWALVSSHVLPVPIHGGGVLAPGQPQAQPGLVAIFIRARHPQPVAQPPPPRPQPAPAPSSQAYRSN